MRNTQHAYNHVAGIYFPIAIGVFALIIVLIGAFLLRGRMRKEPGGRHEAMRTESLYAVVLAGVAAFMVWLTFSTETPEDHLVARPSLTIRVIAAQWSWRFIYPNGATVTTVESWHPAVAEVPAGVTIQFDAESEDVIHGFWLPPLRYQRQLFPGYVNRFDLIFARPGYYGGHCSVYCGQFHSQMYFAIRAVSLRAYRAWVARHAHAPVLRGPAT